MIRFVQSELSALTKNLLYLLRWLGISVLVAILAGSASAALLLSLQWATANRVANPYFIWGLPFLGAAVAWLYLRVGGTAEKGNNLIIEEIHEGSESLPLRMTPLIFIGTVASHIVGASVGREGTALQMGASLADQLARPFRLEGDDRKTLLMCGLSAGFGSIFGVPVAGAIFGLEMPFVGRFRFEAIFPCVLAALLGNLVALAWGVHHVEYSFAVVPALDAVNVGLAILAGIAFGVVARYFSEITHELGVWIRNRLPYAPWRPLIGGFLLLLFFLIPGASRYEGLSLPLIADSFNAPLHFGDFSSKFGLTVLSLASGFKGGEVTPLFCIGATLGSALSAILALPTPLLAAMGFVAVFGGAANTPIAASIMAFELFGSQVGPYATIACITAFALSGHGGIYRSQWKAPGLLPYRRKTD